MPLPHWKTENFLGCRPAAIESHSMPSEPPAPETAVRANPFSANNIAEILRDRGWLRPASESEPDAATQAWLCHAAELLGPQAEDRESLAGLLSLVFHFDAVETLRARETHDVLARSGAREVIRELANRLLEGGDVDSDRFKQIVEDMKKAVPYRSRAMFHPIRLALTGRAGEGELDRVLLLLDSAAKLAFSVAVKSTRQRMLEFCAALD